MTFNFRGDLDSVLSRLMAISPDWLGRLQAHIGIYSARRGADSTARTAPSAVPGASRMPSSTAVIPIVGPLSQRPNFLSDAFGWADYQTIGSTLRAALADSSVSSIAFFIDSPGGVVAGCQELASAIYASRKEKPSVGFVTNLCASAAFWLGSQASRLVAQPTADAGSVGVMGVHLDYSQQLAADGVKATIITSSGAPYKAEGSPLVPLSPEALQYEQGRIDALHAEFVTALARGRGTSTATVQRNFGGGRVLLAREALRAGMIDAIVDSLEEALLQRPGMGRRNGSTTREAAALQREIDILSLS